MKQEVRNVLNIDDLKFFTHEDGRRSCNSSIIVIIAVTNTPLS